MKNKILILNGKQVQDLVEMKKAIQIVRDAFVDHGKGILRMPSKVYLDIPEYEGDFRAMPAFSSKEGLAGVKWVNSHGKNGGTGIPSVMGTMIVNDATNGLPLAVFDATILTNIRTGAAGGVATDALARKKVESIAFIGCGHQARFQLAAILSVRKPTEIRYFDPSKKTAASFRKFASKLFKGKLTETSGPEECVRGAGVITTTTPSRSPIVMNSWISPGCHINAIGADAEGKQELDPEILLRARVFVDEIGQASHSGEINVPLSSGILKKEQLSGNLSTILENPESGRTSDDDITVFDSTGLAIQDMALASYVMKQARKKKIGKLVKLL